MTDTHNKAASGRTIQPIALPDGFDLDRHSQTLERAVSARLAERLGGRWRLVGVDLGEGRAYFSNSVEVASLDGTRVVVLPDTVRPSDGAAQAALLADMYQARYPGQGWVMVDFDPYGHRATMGRLDAEELRAREALATALGVKPWEVKIARASQGGFDADLPPPATCPPSTTPGSGRRSPRSSADPVGGCAPTPPR